MWWCCRLTSLREDVYRLPSLSLDHLDVGEQQVGITSRVKPGATEATQNVHLPDIDVIVEDNTGESEGAW